MSKRIFYVDYENTKAEGLVGIEQLKETDELLIFYTDKADTIPFDLHEKLNACVAKLSIIKVASGTPNALDFQLSSRLGFDIALGGSKDIVYYVVSKDKGYTPLCTFWKNQADVTVNLVSCLMGENPKNGTASAAETAGAAGVAGAASTAAKASAATNAAKAPAKTAAKTPAKAPAKTPAKTKTTATKQENAEDTELANKVKAAVKDLSVPNGDISGIVCWINKYKTKMAINNRLVKRYDSKKAGQIYQALKPLLKDKK